MSDSTDRDRPLILASSSPRRRDLLQQLGLSFTIRPAAIDETTLENETASDYVLRVASDKARAIAQVEPGADVLAADTTVCLAGILYGKPSDAQDAMRMLRILSGCEHEVVTGVVLVTGGREYRKVSISQVTFRPISEEELVDYCRTGEPLDKAGAYALQGRAAAFITEVRGSPSGIVGLPLCETDALLKKRKGRVI